MGCGEGDEKSWGLLLEVVEEGRGLLGVISGWLWEGVEWLWEGGEWLREMSGRWWSRRGRRKDVF